MKKDQFLSLVKNYTALTQEEATELSSLQADFPYSQIVHNLAARAAQDNDLRTREALLHVSAIYTTDRTVLKSIMTASRGERILTPSVGSVQKQDSDQTTIPKAIVKPVKKDVDKIQREETADEPLAQANDLEGDALREHALAELKKLQASRHTFELTMKEFEKGHFFDSKPHKKSHKKTTDSPDTSDSSDTLIEEIKTTKKKVAPEGKQKEQIEIIENFIKTKPSIGKSKAAAAPAVDDLAEKSLLYGDNIVSETLVEILLKQGKKEKAIEVLKKLIWKFPQKKAYFAARIEDLKN